MTSTVLRDLSPTESANALEAALAIDFQGENSPRPSELSPDACMPQDSAAT
jgi:hypothetical protein